MKNAGIAIGLVAIGAGLATIGLNMNGGGTAAHANAPMVQAGGPTIVWYGTDTVLQGYSGQSWAISIIWRAWSDGTVEAMTTRRQSVSYNYDPSDAWCSASFFCTTGWTVVSSPTDGIAAAADINFDQVVDGADIGMLLANWGDAPRSPVPPSDCPLAMINP